MLIKEIFNSIQGEGSLFGTPSLFIRLSGCNLSCPWCDTDHSSGHEVPEKELISLVGQTEMPHVVITGGEPTLQDINPVVYAAIAAGKTVQIETNGTTRYPLPTKPGEVFVTVSPKNPAFVRRNGYELKVMFDGSNDVERLRHRTIFAHYFLQPKWEGTRDNAHEVVSYIQEHPWWRLSLQIHKYIGVP